VIRLNKKRENGFEVGQMVFLEQAEGKEKTGIVLSARGKHYCCGHYRR
jgi:hypothetical protein